MRAARRSRGTLRGRARSIDFAAALLVAIAAPAAASEIEATSDPGDAYGGYEPRELVQKLENPLSDVATVALVNAFEFGAGLEDDAFRYGATLEPVVPWHVAEQWALIHRAVLPFFHQEAFEPGASSETGLGDFELQVFASPRHTRGGVAWGVGPAFRIPTATDEALGPRKWAAGPTGALVMQRGGWTAGSLVSQLWSFAGRGTEDVRITVIDPFADYAFESGFAITFDAEAIYDWQAEEWTVPVGAGVTQLVEIGGQAVDFGLDALYYAARPDTEPRWGIRFGVNFVFEAGKDRPLVDP